jgi:hypothetical protein
MQKITKAAVTKAVIILIIGLVLYLALFSPFALKWGVEDPPITEVDYSTLYKSAKYRLDNSEVVKAKLRDSVTALKTEKGYLEVELNKAHRELDKKRTDYHTAKQKKDTATAIRICDSIVYNVIPVYWDIDSTRHDTQVKVDNVMDSLLRVTEESSKTKDTVITAANGKIKQLKKEKRNLWVALGAAFAVLVAFIAK